MTRSILVVLAVAGVSGVHQDLAAQQFTGEVELEGRLFPKEGLYLGQQRHQGGVRFQPELAFDWNRGRTALTFELFGRLDFASDGRTHADVREASFIHAWDAVEVRAGVRTVFWGVTESVHLVDIINQTDFIENVDGEDKLGQPMVNVAFTHDFGTVDVFLMPFFRERTFAGEHARLRFPVPVQDDAMYEHPDGNTHLDWAVRWSHYFGNFDVGLSWFSGTDREPRLVQPDGIFPPLIAHYDLLEQAGADIQFTSGAWLWKFEGITRSVLDVQSYAFIAGVEYTLYGIADNLADLGLLAEYAYDDRATGFVPFDDDVAVGGRLAFNDTQSTQLLAFAMIDTNGDGAFLNVEGDRRFGENWRAGLEVRAFPGLDRMNPLYVLRNDGYAGITITRFF